MTVTAIVLAGGKGTRIAGLYPDIPKPLIPAAGRPFLYWVTEWLVAEGLADIVYSVGHCADQIERWVAAQSAERGDAVRLRTVTESSPLGTGGGVRACLDLCAEWVVVSNGDSLCQASLGPVWRRITDEALDGALLARTVEDTHRYGSLDVDGSGRLCGFFEKRPGAGLINVGVAVFRRALLEPFPIGVPLSMESEVIPALIGRGANLGVVVGKGAFLDIGTPQSVGLAEGFIRTLFPEARLR
ncbi:MAG: nucleotidyltransferase [Rhodospirillaceae bacterium]|nr:MAG: nucleotidyltransferase [Rhodospirillaceae bacterium]